MSMSSKVGAGKLAAGEFAAGEFAAGKFAPGALAPGTLATATAMADPHGAKRPRLGALRVALALVLDHTPRWVYLLALVPPAVLLAAMCLQPYVPAATLLRDPVTVRGGRFYDGLLSNLGVLIWCTTAAVSLFRGAELRARRPGDPLARFLLYAGALTVMLTLDDLFLIHEDVMPEYLHVPERVYFLTYVVAMLGYLAIGWPHILRTDAPIFVLAMGFFAVSLFVDQLRELRIYAAWMGNDHTVARIIEDGAKLFGIVCWAVFHLRTAWHAGAGAAPAPRADTPA
jgi:hypothetical protein